MNMKKYLNISLIYVLSILTLNGCVPLIVAGVTTTSFIVAKDKRSFGAMIDDQTIKYRVSSAISKNKALKQSGHISIHTYNGNVLLVGQVPNEKMKHTLIDLCKSVPKIKRVFNETTIAGPNSILNRSSDTYITSKIKAKLLLTKNIRSTNIKVITENGATYLLGISSPQEGNIIANIASNVNGVQRVVKLFEYSRNS